MDDGLKKAYDLHAEIAKQLITISTGLLALLAAVAKLDGVDISFSGFTITSLFSLFLSLCFGIFHLGALAKAAEENKSIQETSACLVTARAQQITFGVAIVAFLIGLIPAPELNSVLMVFMALCLAQLFLPG